MSEPQTVTPDHLRSLLGAADSSALVLIEGRVEVLSAEQLDAPDHRGALEVIAKSDLVERAGTDPHDRELDALAAALTTAVQQHGG